VIVTSAVTQSGSVISGDVVAVATVTPNPGYEGDPGHAGTGTVLSVTPCSS
jgi:predicted RecA/RadA family phage recombinase